MVSSPPPALILLLLLSPTIRSPLLVPITFAKLTTVNCCRPAPGIPITVSLFRDKSISKETGDVPLTPAGAVPSIVLAKPVGPIIVSILSRRSVPATPLLTAPPASRVIAPPISLKSAVSMPSPP